MRLAFLDGNDLRAAELRRVVPALDFDVVALPTAYSTSAPEPGQRARDKVLASELPRCFAEAVDLTTMDGKSLRLELDSENANRFCRWWRETPTRMLLAVALRRAAGAEIELISSSVEGRIAEKPAGPAALGWDRLFIPAGETSTLAELAGRGLGTPLREEPYRRLAALLDEPPAGASS
ncbi:MAG: non-canonical purine NTP pyrophosphatase [Kofleriaceae bacterium]